MKPGEDDVLAVPRVGDIQRQQGAEAPHVAAVGAIPAHAGLLGQEPFEIHDDLDGPPVLRAQVHERIGRVFGPAGSAFQAGGQHGWAPMTSVNPGDSGYHLPAREMLI